MKIKKDEFDGFDIDIKVKKEKYFSNGIKEMNAEYHAYMIALYLVNGYIDESDLSEIHKKGMKNWKQYNTK